MKCLSLYQPWAVLLAHGLKRIETRSWPYPGELPVVLAVHASKKWNLSMKHTCDSAPFRGALMTLGYGVPVPTGGGGHRIAVEELDRGQVVGLVRLVECVRTDQILEGRSLGRTYLRSFQEEAAFGDYSAGRHAWVCDRFHPLAVPIPLRGRQKVWNWEAPEHVLQTVEEMLQTPKASATTLVKTTRPW